MTYIIEVGVYGGLVQWVRGIPRDLEVKVHDYDVDGVDKGIVSSDSGGNPCVVITYRGSEQGPNISEAE